MMPILPPDPSALFGDNEPPPIELKMWPEFFEPLRTGEKTFDLRKADRPFQVGGILHLREWDPTTREYTGRSVRRRILYIADLTSLGFPGYVGMSLAEVPSPMDPDAWEPMDLDERDGKWLDDPGEPRDRT